MRNPEFPVETEAWNGRSGHVVPMRVELADRFGALWQQKSVAEMLLEVSQWCDHNGMYDTGLICLTKDTVLALAVYAGIREDDYGD